MSRLDVFFGGLAIAALSLSLVSCGDSDDGDGAATTESTSTTESTTTTTATPTSSTTTASTTTTSTTAATTTTATLGDQPEVIDRTISPSWVAELGEDFEDLPSLIESVQGGGEAPQMSDAMAQIMAAGLPDGPGLPYYYEAESAEGLVIAEEAITRLDNGDSLSAGWRFRWADTPACCPEDPLLWDNGWLVWTDADPERGMIWLLAEHSQLPLNAEIVHFPDPLQWPEALPENDPILATSPQEAEATAAAILDAVEATISIPAS